MTIIVWDGKTLAADKRSCYGNMVCTVTKIQRIGDLLVGGAGDVSFIQEMFEWVRRGRLPEQFPNAQRSKEDWQPIMVIEPDGKPTLYERSPYPIRYEQQCMATGSGREFARAALFLGCDARAAVEVACALDQNCGNGIDTLTL